MLGLFVIIGGLLSNRYGQGSNGVESAFVAAAASAPVDPLSSWSQQLQASRRFQVLAAFQGAAVLDRETGLVWEKSPNPTTYFEWADAIDDCANKSVGGRKGWRLPSFVELASLVDPANSNPALPIGHPFIGVQSDSYWTATTFARSLSAAWIVRFSDGLVGDPGKTDSTNYAWCVRGGMNADQY